MYYMSILNPSNKTISYNDAPRQQYYNEIIHVCMNERHAHTIYRNAQLTLLL